MITVSLVLRIHWGWEEGGRGGISVPRTLMQRG